MAVIKRLTDKSNNNEILYPQTTTQAVYGTDNTRLDYILADKIEADDSVLGVPVPVDADTLDGHAASYFAQASSVWSASVSDNILIFTGNGASVSDNKLIIGG